MSGALYLALSGMQMKSKELEVVAHNLSNANTDGYREESVSFASMLTGQEGNVQSPLASTKKHRLKLEAGPVRHTNNPLDLALQGEGFFEIQTDSGVLYTRNGSFTLNAQGQLSTLQGFRVAGANGDINIGRGQDVQISANGTVTVDGSEVGQIKLVEFADISALKPAGGSLLSAEAGAQPTTAAMTTVSQGKVEGSNTSVMRNLVKMIEISRQYASYQKVVDNHSDVDRNSISSLGRVS